MTGRILTTLRRWHARNLASIGATEPACHCGGPPTHLIRASRGTGIEAWLTRRTRYACSPEHANDAALAILAEIKQLRGEAAERNNQPERTETMSENSPEKETADWQTAIDETLGGPWWDPTDNRVNNPPGK